MTTENVLVEVRGAERRAQLFLPDVAHHTVVFVHGSGFSDLHNFDGYCNVPAKRGCASLVVDKVMDGYTTQRRDHSQLV